MLVWMYEDAANIVQPLLLLRLVKYLPAITFHGHKINPVEILLNLSVPCVFMLAFAMVSYNVFSTDLYYRCVPTTEYFASMTASEKVFGISYYESEFNVDFCHYQ
jgi:hypothetical protein